MVSTKNSRKNSIARCNKKSFFRDGLPQVYESYVSRFRNLDYLEYELDQLNREEESRMEQNARELKRLQKRLREEEWRMLRGAY